MEWGLRLLRIGEYDEAKIKFKRCLVVREGFDEKVFGFVTQSFMSHNLSCPFSTSSFSVSLAYIHLILPLLLFNVSTIVYHYLGRKETEPHHG